MKNLVQNYLKSLRSWNLWIRLVNTWNSLDYCELIAEGARPNIKKLLDVHRHYISREVISNNINQWQFVTLKIVFSTSALAF